MTAHPIVAALAIVHTMGTGVLTAPVPADDPTPADCVDWWHVCQPGNPEGKPAACFDAGGVVEAWWPCTPTLPPGPVAANAAPEVVRLVDYTTPPPSPGVLAPGANGQAPAVTMLPPVCGQAMWVCGFHWSPDDGLWHASGSSWRSDARDLPPGDPLNPRSWPCGMSVGPSQDNPTPRLRYHVRGCPGGPPAP